MTNLTYSPTKDLAPVGLILFAPYVLAVHPSLPVKTVAELVAYDKANPGKLRSAMRASASANHISAVQSTRTGASRSSTCRIAAAPMPSGRWCRARAR